MSYSISLEFTRLLCRTPRKAALAADLINNHGWMRSHIRVSPAPATLPVGASRWQLVVEYFDGSAWRADLASEVWQRLTRYLAERSVLEVRTEQGERFRYRWEHGQVYLDEPVLTIWREHSLLAPFPRLEEPDAIRAPDAAIINAPRPSHRKSGAGGRNRR